ncbi:excitatory amino acid transporter 5-like isoform X3 [Ambystoma mexicanum]|uniref:excitatory amino acid transporter 5-like isoform X3 n=1 Tax=Ambystoma mexicanum TaxID=8296 RepID=UPI0037E90E82
MWERIKKALLNNFPFSLADVVTWLRNYWKKNGLLTLSMLSVITGCLIGFLLRALELSDQEKQYFSFPGELLMRMLKMLILPLITSSLMSGLATMDSKVCGKMGLITITYYLWTTFLAVAVGIILVICIHPGAAAQKEEHIGGKPILSSADALLDLIRNMFPANLIEASFQQYRTVLIPVVKSQDSKFLKKSLSFIYFAPDDKNPEIHRPVLLEITPSPQMSYKTRPGTNTEMNVLGIVIFSATIGLLLGKMGDRGAPLVNVCQCLNEAVMKIVSVAVWYFPFGIVFLIAGKILDMEDPATIGKKLGLYAITVMAGLFIHGVILLPLLYLIFTKKNPFPFIQGILQALLIALATSSSITATAASIGAAGIPQSGLVTMVIVLTSVGLPTDDITLIVAVDWALDRFRTMTNVLGDALAAGIVAHICRREFAALPEKQNLLTTAEPCSNNQRRPITKEHEVMEIIEEALAERTGIHYNVCQV